jgi:hypothetical protein
MSNAKLVNPRTGTTDFGIVPEMKSMGIILPGGRISLPQGRHSGPNRGFGARHIWVEHGKELIGAGFESEATVPMYVATIVRAGTSLMFEGASYRHTRLIAVRDRSGMAILEQKGSGADVFWSVVTAFTANKKHGTRVGTVLDIV